MLAKIVGKQLFYLWKGLYKMISIFNGESYNVYVVF